MRLIDTLKLMHVEGSATGGINIKLREYGFPTRYYYDGTLINLLNYIRKHENLEQSDGFPIQVLNIKNWDVVEILVDRTIEEEKRLPDYNKGKIIVIM